MNVANELNQEKNNVISGGTYSIISDRLMHFSNIIHAVIYYYNSQIF